jgi:hypothetical protein
MAGYVFQMYKLLDDLITHRDPEKGVRECANIPLQELVPGVDFPQRAVGDIYLVTSKTDQYTLGACLTYDGIKPEYGTVSLLMTPPPSDIESKIAERIPKIKEYAESIGYELVEDSEYLVELRDKSTKGVLRNKSTEGDVFGKIMINTVKGDNPALVVTVLETVDIQPERAASYLTEVPVKKMKDIITVAFSDGFYQDLVDMNNEAKPVYVLQPAHLIQKTH